MSQGPRNALVVAGDEVLLEQKDIEVAIREYVERYGLTVRQVDLSVMRVATTPGGKPTQQVSSTVKVSR